MKKILNSLEGWFCGIVLAGMLILLVAQVVLRWLGSTNVWSEEMARYMFVWVVYVGGSFATLKDAHIRIELALRVWPKVVRPYAKILGNVLWLVFGIFLLYQSLLLDLNSWTGNTYSICLGINMVVAYLGITVGYFMMLIRVVQAQLIPSIKEAIHKDKKNEKEAML